MDLAKEGNSDVFAAGKLPTGSETGQKHLCLWITCFGRFVGADSIAAMNGLSYSANSAIEEGRRQASGAVIGATEAKDWCLRANTAHWESPAAAVFSRWLSELVLRSRQGVSQVGELPAAISRI